DRPRRTCALRPHRDGDRRVLPRAQLRRRPPADRLGLQPVRRRRAQPRAALLLHRGVRGPAGRPVHLGGPQGLAAQRGGDRRVHRQPDPGGAVRAGQRHRHGLPRGHQRGAGVRDRAGAQRARGGAPGGRVTGVGGVHAALHRAPGRQHRGVRPGAADQRPGGRRARRAAPDRAPQAAGAAGRQRVVDDRRGPRDPADPLRDVVGGSLDRRAGQRRL
ncbi:MAG: Nitrilotriacetate monooxygenase component B, partial [uncultured Blastococcus sp.]